MLAAVPLYVLAFHLPRPPPRPPSIVVTAGSRTTATAPLRPLPNAAMPSAPRRAMAERRRCGAPAAFEDGVAVTFALTAAAAAGYLQYSLSSGEKGLSAFLMKEAKDNPFYKADYKAEKPKPPAWLTLQLPQLDFVEVYGQQAPRGEPAGGGGAGGALDGLDERYAALDEAIEREDYAAAETIMGDIDRLKAAEAAAAAAERVNREVPTVGVWRARVPDEGGESAGRAGRR